MSGQHASGGAKLKWDRVQGVTPHWMAYGEEANWYEIKRVERGEYRVSYGGKHLFTNYESLAHTKRRCQTHANGIAATKEQSS